MELLILDQINYEYLYIKSSNLKKFFKNNRTKDINNINFEKIKKILKLPDIFEEAKNILGMKFKKNNLL